MWAYSNSGVVRLLGAEEEEEVLVRGCHRALNGLGCSRSYRDFSVIWIRTEIP